MKGRGFKKLGEICVKRGNMRGKEENKEGKRGKIKKRNKEEKRGKEGSSRDR